MNKRNILEKEKNLDINDLDKIKIVERIMTL